MRESIAAALHSSLEDVPDRDCPITRIAAFSRAPRLGTLLWRLKYSSDAKSHKPALLIIASKLPRHLTHSYRRKVAEAALHEWLSDQCRVCNGARELLTDTLRVVCSACEGSGKHRYSDRERERVLGGSGVKWVGKAMAVITGADISAARVTAYQLERT